MKGPFDVKATHGAIPRHKAHSKIGPLPSGAKSQGRNMGTPVELRGEELCAKEQEARYLMLVSSLRTTLEETKNIGPLANGYGPTTSPRREPTS